MSARAPFLPSRPASRAAHQLAATISGQAKGSTGKDAAGPEAHTQKLRSGGDITDSSVAETAPISTVNRPLNLVAFKKPKPDGAGARPPSRTMNAFNEAATRARSPTHWPEQRGMRIHAPRPRSPLFPNSSVFTSTMSFKEPSLPLSFSAGLNGQIDEYISTSEGNNTSENAPGAMVEEHNLIRTASPFKPNGLLAFSRLKASGPSLESIQEDAEEPGVANARPEAHILRRMGKKRSFAVVEDYEGNSGGLSKRLKSGDSHVNSDNVGRPHSSRRNNTASMPSSSGYDLVQQHEQPRRSSFFGGHDSLVSPTSAPDRLQPSEVSQAPQAPQFAMFVDMFGISLTEADVEQYAEMYERERQRWNSVSLEEHKAGEAELMGKIGKLVTSVSASLLARSCLN